MTEAQGPGHLSWPDPRPWAPVLHSSNLRAFNMALLALSAQC